MNRTREHAQKAIDSLFDAHKKIGYLQTENELKFDELQELRAENKKLKAQIGLIKKSLSESNQQEILDKWLNRMSSIHLPIDLIEEIHNAIIERLEE